MFNSRSILLNNVVCHFHPVSRYCTFCKSFPETYVHLFWECSKSAYIWTFVHSLTLEKYRSKEISLFPTKVPNHIVFLYTLCKYYIHICRCFKIQPNLPHFKKKLGFHLQALKCECIMRNKEQSFDKTWTNILNRL